MKTVKSRLANKKGFTLVEIIVVLVILAILAAAAVPTMLGYVEDARGKAYAAEARVGYAAAQAALTEILASEGTVTKNGTTNVVTAYTYKDGKGGGKLNDHPVFERMTEGVTGGKDAFPFIVLDDDGDEVVKIVFVSNVAESAKANGKAYYRIEIAEEKPLDVLRMKGKVAYTTPTSP